LPVTRGNLKVDPLPSGYSYSCLLYRYKGFHIFKCSIQTNPVASRL
jgi:hypothetical protein